MRLLTSCFPPNVVLPPLDFHPPSEWVMSAASYLWRCSSHSTGDFSRTQDNATSQCRTMIALSMKWGRRGRLSTTEPDESTRSSFRMIACWNNWQRTWQLSYLNYLAPLNDVAAWFTWLRVEWKGSLWNLEGYFAWSLSMNFFSYKVWRDKSLSILSLEAFDNEC